MSPMTSHPLTIEYALMGFMRERPMHGYEIHQRLSEHSGMGLVWRVKQSRMYSLLDRLEREGYITATLEQQEARPPRKLFELTESGKSAFMEWVQAPVENGRKLRLEFMAKLYFARLEGAETAGRLIDRQVEVCREWLREQQEYQKERGEHPYDWLVVQFRIGQIEAMVSWLETCRHALYDMPRAVE